MDPVGIRNREDWFEKILRDPGNFPKKRKFEPDAEQFWDDHNFNRKMPKDYAPLTVRGERVLKGSTHENAAIKAPALVGKKRKGNPNVALSYFARNYFKAMQPRFRWFEEGSDMRFSTKYSVGPPETLVRVGGVAAVFVKSYSMADIQPVWAAAVQTAAHTAMAQREDQNSCIDFTLKSEYTWKNLTNVNVRIHMKEFFCRQDCIDGQGVLESWALDTTNKIGYSNKYSALTALNAVDVIGAHQDVRSIHHWNIGGVGGEVRQYWGAGSKWSVAILPPGGVLMKTMVYNGTQSYKSFTENTFDQGSRYVVGMPALLVKCVGEDIYNPQSTDELAAEAGTNAQVSGNAPQYTTAPVQLMENVKVMGSAKYIPGYQAEFITIGTRAAATLGQVGIIPDLPYDVAKNYERINGDGNGINGYADCGSYTVLEGVAADAAGAEEGMAYMVDDD